MKKCCGICGWYEHVSGHCDAPLPESAPTYDTRWMKPTDGKKCDTFELACPSCYEDCKHSGRFDNDPYPKTCKLMRRKRK